MYESIHPLTLALITFGAVVLSAILPVIKTKDELNELKKKTNGHKR